MNESAIFNAAVKLPLDQRPAFVHAACAGNPQLRADVDALLHEHEQAGSFISRPAIESPPTDHFQPIAEGPGTQIGPYKLREQIGEGGFGVVYVAEQEKPVRRKVALKIIKPGMDTKDVIARFEAERQALALMDHPNVARVLDAGATDSGRPYFVMELVHGVPITEFCDKNKLPTRDRLLLFADVCRAVQHAHQKGIIHRDLKPSNIMVTLHDGKPVAKVIDFGVSKALSQQLTEKSIYTAYGQMIGTPSYMSPEQAEMSGLGIDTRSDIYSLGVLLYELLTGKTPLDAKRLREGGYGEMMRMIRDEEPPRPSLKISTLGDEATTIAQHRHTDPHQLRRSLRGELDWIVMKCLEKDRARRYETANSLARDVERYLQDEPVEACPPSATYRARKFAGKHKASLAVATAFLGLLLTGVAVSTWQRNVALEAATSERRAKEAEAKERERAEANEKSARDSEQVAQQQRDAATEAQQSATQAQQSAVQEKNNALAAREELRQTLYAAEMNLTQVAWDSKQFPRVEQLLKEQPDDLRGFEWHYWQRKLHRGQLKSVQVAKLTPTDRYKEAIAFSRGGERLAAIVDYPDADLNQKGFGLLAMFDGATGRELITPVDPFPDWREGQNKSRKLAMSADGSRLAITLGIGGELRPTDKPFDRISIRDGKTGQEIRSIPSPGSITEISLSPDGSRLAVYGFEDFKARDYSNRTFTIWDTSTGELIAALPKLLRIDTGSVWSPDGSRMLRKAYLGEDIYSLGSLFQVVEVASGKELWRREILNLPALALNVWAWSPDGNYLVMAQSRNAGAKPLLQLWDSNTGQVLAILDRESESPIHRNSIDFSPTGRHLAALSATNEIFLWEMPELPTSAPEGPLDIAAPNLTLRTSEEVRAVRFSEDGQKLHAVGKTSLITWDATLREDQGLGPETFGDFYGGYSIRTVAISRDRTKLALSSGSTRKEFGIWDLTTDRELCRLKLDEEYTFSTPEFSPDGKHIALAKRIRTPEESWQIVIHDTHTGDPLHTISEGEPARSNINIFGRGNLFYRPDGKQIAALHNRAVQDDPKRLPRLMVWDADTQKELFSVNLQIGEGNRERLMGYSPDGSTLVVVSYDHNSTKDSAVVLYDAATGMEQRSILLPGALRPIAVDFIGKSIIASVRSAEPGEPTRLYGLYGRSDIVVLDLDTGLERARLRGHGGFDHFDIAPDGSRIVLGYSPPIRGASTFSIWSLKSGRRLLEFNRSGAVSALGLSPDGHRLIATFSRRPNLGSDTSFKPIQIWDATPLPEKP